MRPQVDALIRQALLELSSVPRAESPRVTRDAPSGWVQALRGGRAPISTLRDAAQAEAARWKHAAAATSERGRGPVEQRAELLRQRQLARENEQRANEQRANARARVHQGTPSQPQSVQPAGEHARGKAKQSRKKNRRKTYKEHVFESQMDAEMSSIVERYAEPSMVLGPRAATNFRPPVGLNDPAPHDAAQDAQDGRPVSAEVDIWRVRRRPSGARVRSW